MEGNAPHQGQPPPDNYRGFSWILLTVVWHWTGQYHHPTMWIGLDSFPTPTLDMHCVRTRN